MQIEISINKLAITLLIGLITILSGCASVETVKPSLNGPTTPPTSNPEGNPPNSN